MLYVIQYSHKKGKFVINMQQLLMSSKHFDAWLVEEPTNNRLSCAVPGLMRFSPALCLWWVWEVRVPLRSKRIIGFLLSSCKSNATFGWMQLSKISLGLASLSCPRGSPAHQTPDHPIFWQPQFCVQDCVSTQACRLL